MPTDQPPTTGPQVRELRTAARISARQLARDAGISHSHLVRFEAGERDVATVTLHRLLAAIAAGQRDEAAS